MCSNSKLPRHLLIENDEYVDGLEIGMYPDARRRIDESGGDFQILRRRDVNKNLGMFVTTPYSGSVYELQAGKYLDVMDASYFSSEVRLRKSLACKEALYMMGAKKIELKNVITQMASAERDAIIGGGRGEIEGGVAISHDDDRFVHLEQKIHLEDVNSKPYPIDKIWEFMDKRGISDEPMLEILFGRLKMNNSENKSADCVAGLRGKESVVWNTVNECKDARYALATASVLGICGGINLNRVMNEIQCSEVSVYVNFDSVE